MGDFLLILVLPFTTWVQWTGTGHRLRGRLDRGSNGSKREEQVGNMQAQDHGRGREKPLHRKELVMHKVWRHSLTVGVFTQFGIVDIMH